MNKLTLIRPDDWHCHFRDHSCLERTVADISTSFRRAVAMPNLPQPITHVKQAEDYYRRIREYIPMGRNFHPLMTLYLTESMPVQELLAAKESKHVLACKLYPAGATTHSALGVNQIENIYPLLEKMQEIDLPLLVHAEVTDPHIKSIDREAVFIEREFSPLLKRFPNLRMVFEHVSTKVAVDFVKENGDNLAATITPHHLILTNEACLDNHPLYPHSYCLPIVKSEKNRVALIEAATQGNPKFFLGTDSAPHSKSQKESSHPPAGIYNAPVALAIYAEVFAEQLALDKLEGFSSIHGANFYRLPINTDSITLIHRSIPVPTTLPFGPEVVVPLMAGKTLSWQIENP